MLFKLSYLSSNFSLTLGYLNLASNNPTQKAIDVWESIFIAYHQLVTKGCLEAPNLLIAKVFTIYVPNFPLSEPIRLQDLEDSARSRAFIIWPFHYGPEPAINYNQQMVIG